MSKSKQVLSQFAPVKIILTALFSYLIATHLLVSCNIASKNSKPSSPEDAEFLLITDFDQKEFELNHTKIETEIENKAPENAPSETDPSGSPETNTSELSPLSSDKKFGKLSYKTKSLLMDNVPVIGQSDTNYKIRYIIEGKLLRIYKVSAREQLSEQEKLYSTPVIIFNNKMLDVSPEKGPTIIPEKSNETEATSKDKQHQKLTLYLKQLLKTPLVSYPITGFYKMISEKNQKADEPTKFEIITDGTKETATHFKIDILKQELFENSNTSNDSTEQN